MKKILNSLLVLSLIFIVGCSTSTKHSAKSISSSITKSTSHKKKTKTEQNQKKHSATNTSQSNTPSVNNSKKESSDTYQPNSPQTSNSKSTSTSSVTTKDSTMPPDYHSLFEGETLTSFLNKYGESPAAYLSDHYGMSAKEALYATPDNLESFGERQTEGFYREGKDPYANN